MKRETVGLRQAIHTFHQVLTNAGCMLGAYRTGSFIVKHTSRPRKATPSETRFCPGAVACSSRTYPGFMMGHVPSHQSALMTTILSHTSGRPRRGREGGGIRRIEYLAEVWPSAATITKRAEPRRPGYMRGQGYGLVDAEECNAWNVAVFKSIPKLCPIAFLRSYASPRSSRSNTVCTYSNATTEHDRSTQSVAFWQWNALATKPNEPSRQDRAC